MKDSDLEQHYKLLDTRYRVVEDHAYARLVICSDAAALPVHRWFRFKEAYSPELFSKVLAEVGLDRAQQLRVLDPYSGSGTTVLSALEWGAVSGCEVVAQAVESNPFLHFVSATKVAAAQERPHGLQALSEWLWKRLDEEQRDPPPPPGLSTFAQGEYFPDGTLDELLCIRRLLGEALAEESVRALAQLALAASVEAASMLRRDGRALRHVPDKRTKSPRELVVGRLQQMMDDLGAVRVAGEADVHRGDGRRLDVVGTDDLFDLALFSPPYPNNIDYTEVYKLEAWFLGFYATQEDFRAQRLRTVRSHPSIVFDEELYHRSTEWSEDFGLLVEPLLAAIPQDRYAAQRARVVEGYCDDMLRTLQGVFRRLRAGGVAVVVVGNSLHGGREHPYLIASDLLIARLAEFVGFEVDRIIEARRPSRRGKDQAFLRESLVVLRRS